MYYEPNIVTLLDPDTGSHISVELQMPNRTARYDLRKASLKAEQALQQVNNTYNDVVTLIQKFNSESEADTIAAEYGERLYQFMMGQNDDIRDRANDYTLAVEQCSEIGTIKRFQAIVNATKLAPDAATKVMSSPDSNFWTYQQDLAPLVAGIERFRAGLQPRQ